MNMQRAFLIGLLSIGLLGLTGCATRYAVRVDALAGGAGGEPGRGLTYVLASGTPGVDESELFFKEVARHLQPVLADRGFRAAGPGEAADLRIGVDAHLSAPMVETRSYSEPVHVEYGGHAEVVRVPVVGSDGKVTGYTYSRYWVPSERVFAGWVERDRQFTVYDKVLRLSARALQPDGSLSDELWMIRVALRDTSSDYRAALPYMLVAAAPHIGSRTDGEKVILIDGDSPEVQSYRAGLGNGR